MYTKCFNIMMKSWLSLVVWMSTAIILSENGFSPQKIISFDKSPVTWFDNWVRNWLVLGCLQKAMVSRFYPRSSNKVANIGCIEIICNILYNPNWSLLLCKSNTMVLSLFDPSVKQYSQLLSQRQTLSYCPLVFTLNIWSICPSPQDINSVISA